MTLLDLVLRLDAAEAAVAELLTALVALEEAVPLPERALHTKWGIELEVMAGRLRALRAWLAEAA